MSGNFEGCPVYKSWSTVAPDTGPIFTFVKELGAELTDHLDRAYDHTGIYI